MTCEPPGEFHIFNAIGQCQNCGWSQPVIKTSKEQPIPKSCHCYYKSYNADGQCTSCGNWDPTYPGFLLFESMEKERQHEETDRFDDLEID